VKRLAGAVCIAAGMFVGAGIASAEYQQPGAALVLNPSRVVPGGTVTVSLQVTCVDGDSIGFQIEPAGDQSAAICNAKPTPPGSPLHRDPAPMTSMLKGKCGLPRPR
jgi:hypothetical protein